MKRKIKAIWRIIRAKQYAVMTDDPEGGYRCLYYLLGGLPKQAKAWDYADIIHRRATIFTTALRLHADKIQEIYKITIEL